MSEEEVVVGADIGTKTSVVAGIESGNAFVVDIALDSKTANTNNLFDEAGNCLISVRDLSNLRKGDIIIEHFKPFMGRTYPADGYLEDDIRRWNSSCHINEQGYPVYPVRGDNVRPEQSYALQIRFLAQRYQKQTHKTPTRFVLAVPAYWPSPRRQAVLDAVSIAGYTKGTVIITEPVAAVIGTTKKHPDIKGTDFVCIDIGGGTTDVALIHVNDERTLFIVEDTAGDNELGGEHFTMALVDVCKGKMKGTEVAEHKLRHACEMAKTSGRYPMEIQLNDESSIKVTKSEYKDACQEILKRLGNVIDEVFKKKKDVKVIIVGGAFRDEVIFEYCKKKIGRGKFIPPYSLSTPVAEGAAWVGQPNSGIVVIDSLHQNIGIESQNLSKGKTDKFNVVLKRGQGIPTEFNTDEHNYEYFGAPGGETHLKIFQGDRKTASQNVHLFTYKFACPAGAGIPLLSQLILSNYLGGNGADQSL
ncbi:hypothetical protein AU210_016405 [Fusarium oxysporum f. sp. radicis-cucumerinum]|uniref:Uncharacterized protein n=1 Tax=Fusarium oxysporum f. sp. radicis-cucumerinum TaxID=327505 RepID=A0A2H3G711_FUSOX|nr:hypothetical protein AU210_016405 [Fusarium oxysporum f. sp. radicis-cucumerinum]